MRIGPMLLLLVVLAAACREPVVVPEVPSYAADVEPVVLDRCLSCHELDDPKAQLVLTPGMGYDQMVGRSSVQVEDLLIVEPGNLAGSYLWHKLEWTAAVGDGMPRTVFGARKLPPDELELFRRWIESGARP